MKMECTEIDLNKVCRTCKNEAAEMKSLYYRDSESGKENLRLDEMLMACASIQVDTEDSLPKLICRSCFVQLKNAYIFKEQCEKTDVFLRNYLQTIKDIKVENELLDDLEFTTSEVVCDIKPPRLSNENGNREATDEITDNLQVGSEKEGEKENADYIQMVVNNVIIYKCIVCSKQFYTLEGLKCHQRLHMDKAFKCKECDRTYTRLNHLQRHQLSHGKRKMYVCNICNKSFTRYEHLKRHLTTHLKTRPFSCPICKRGFNRVQCLEKHVTICKGRRMYVCDICNSAFRREDSMLVHKREHEHKAAVLPMLENLNNIQEYYTKVEVNDETRAFSDKDSLNVVEKNVQPDSNDQVRTEIAPIINYYPDVQPSEMLLEKVKIEEELSLVNDNDVGQKQAPTTDNGNDYESNDSVRHKYKPTKQSTPIVKRGRGRPRKYPVGYQSGGKPKGSKVSKRRRILQRSIKAEGGEIERLEIKPFQCEMCKKSFPRKERLQKHMKLLHLKSGAFKCDLCQAVFSREEDLTKHKTSKHNSLGTVVDIKRKDSQTKVHIGENKFQCKTCGKTFLSKSHFTEHTKFHNDSMKKFLCSECGQKFIRRDFLAIHMRRHRGEKPFKCKFCAYSFTRLADLTAHEKNHTGEKTHLCALCGRGFGRAYYLTLHMRRHTGEKPYRCSYCDAAFVQGNDLKVHVRRHTGERFSCDLCPRTFLTASLLTQHKRVVHGLNVVSNIRRSEVVKQLDPNDIPPETLTLSSPNTITNSLKSDPL